MAKFFPARRGARSTGSYFAVRGALERTLRRAKRTDLYLPALSLIIPQFIFYLLI